MPLKPFTRPLQDAVPLPLILSFGFGWRCLHDTHLEPTHVSPVEGCTNSLAQFCRHLLCLLCRLAKFSVKKDPMEVCPFSRRAMLQPLSTSLQGGFRFLHLPIPTLPSVSLTVAFPLRENDGLTTFPIRTQNGWVRLRLFADGVPSAARDVKTLALSHLPFGPSLLYSAPLACWFSRRLSAVYIC